MAVLVALLPACVPSIPKEALQLTQDSLENRQLQTRRYETGDEAKLLSASAGVLQDIGFNLDESETELGLIVGSKERSAVDGGQVAGAVFLALLTGVVVPVDNNQLMRASLVTKKAKQDDNFLVRVTFQRIVWNTDGRINRTEPIHDVEVYQEFFSKLSKSVFLEGHKI